MIIWVTRDRKAELLQAEDFRRFKLEVEGSAETRSVRHRLWRKAFRQLLLSRMAETIRPTIE